MGLRATSIAERFERHVERIPFATCHYWAGGLDKFGYGIFWVNEPRPKRLAHRMSYELNVGPIPEGLNILHSCDNPMCVNPDHLRPGTQAENVRDAVNRKRISKGEAHTSSKLSASAVKQIAERARAGERCSDLAAEFGISPSRVSGIWRGKLRSSESGASEAALIRQDCKIAPEVALEIYRAGCAGEGNKSLAAKYGVKPSFIADIKRGATYAAITGHRR